MASVILWEEIAAVIIIPMIIYGFAVCLFGYKLFKLQIIVSGFVMGLLAGGLFGALSSAEMAVLCGLVLGILCGWLSMKLYKLGVFLMVTTSSFFVIAIGASLYMGFSSMTMVMSVILAIVFGVAGVILDKTIIIAYTAITGALISGTGLALSAGAPGLVLVLGIPFALLGIWMQHCMERKEPAAGKASESRMETNQQEPKKETNFSIGEATKAVTHSVKNLMDFTEEKLDSIKKNNPNQKILVSNEGRFWTSGMPVLVTETQIVTQAEDESQVFFNIRVQNLSDQPVIGIYFDIDCYDLLKQNLESVKHASFLDLNIAQGAYWLSTNSIPLPDKTTRKCVVTVKNVVLKNEEIWENTGCEALQELEEAEGLQLPVDLREEYHTEIEERMNASHARNLYQYKMAEKEDYWNCSCGQVNINRLGYSGCPADGNFPG